MNNRTILVSCTLVIIIIMVSAIFWRNKDPQLTNDSKDHEDLIPTAKSPSEDSPNSLKIIGGTSFTEKYNNEAIGFSLLMPKGIIVKEKELYEGSIQMISIDETGYEDRFKELWWFYTDNKNPARNAQAESLDDYMQDYAAPDIADHFIQIHSQQRINENTLRQEYSYGYWNTVGEKKIFTTGTLGCDICYFAQHNIRYVYYNPKNQKFVIFERLSLEQDKNEIAYQAYKNKADLAERIAQTFRFE